MCLITFNNWSSVRCLHNYRVMNCCFILNLDIWQFCFMRSVYLFIYASFKDSLQIWPATRATQQQSITYVLHTASAGTDRNTYRALIENPEGRRPFGRPTRRWEDKIEIEQNQRPMSVNCSHLSLDSDCQQQTLANTSINSRNPRMRRILTCWGTVISSRRNAPRS